MGRMLRGLVTSAFMCFRTAFGVLCDAAEVQTGLHHLPKQAQSEVCELRVARATACLAAGLQRSCLVWSCLANLDDRVPSLLRKICQAQGFAMT